LDVISREIARDIPGEMSCGITPEITSKVAMTAIFGGK
jgi:hypothetical protein